MPKIETTPNGTIPGDLIPALLDTIDLKANSTLITIFGDAISPRGGEIWLGSLITLAATLGISEQFGADRRLPTVERRMVEIGITGSAGILFTDRSRR